MKNKNNLLSIGKPINKNIGNPIYKLLTYVKNRHMNNKHIYKNIHMSRNYIHKYYEKPRSSNYILERKNTIKRDLNEKNPIKREFTQEKSIIINKKVLLLESVFPLLKGFPLLYTREQQYLYSRYNIKVV